MAPKIKMPSLLRSQKRHRCPPTISPAEDDDLEEAAAASHDIGSSSRAATIAKLLLEGGTASADIVTTEHGERVNGDGRNDGESDGEEGSSDLDDLFETSVVGAHREDHACAAPRPAPPPPKQSSDSIAKQIEREEEDRSEMILFYMGERSLLEVGIDLDALDGFRRWRKPKKPVDGAAGVGGGGADCKNKRQQQLRQQKKKKSSNDLRRQSISEEMLKFYLGKITLSDVGINLQDPDELRRWRPKFRLSSIPIDEQVKAVEAETAAIDEDGGAAAVAAASVSPSRAPPVHDASPVLQPVRPPVRCYSEDEEVEASPDDVAAAEAAYRSRRQRRRSDLIRYYTGEIQLTDVYGIGDMDQIKHWGEFGTLFRTDSDEAGKKEQTTVTAKATATVQRVPQTETTVQKHVSFTRIEIRDYVIVLGDHPDCSSGPPISLGWSYFENEPIEVDCYESTRAERRQRHSMIMPSFDRRDMLKYSLGYSERDIIDAEKEARRVRKLRGVSCIERNPVRKAGEEVLHSATKTLSRFRRSAP